MISDRSAAALAALDRAAADALGRAGGTAVARARALAPVRTGALRDSIGCAVDFPTLTVGAAVPYAPRAELEHPFLEPALLDVAGELRQAVEASLRQA